MIPLIISLAVGLGFLTGDIKEFFFRNGYENELGMVLFRIIIAVSFCQINIMIIILNKYLAYFESTFKAKILTENIKIVENHNHISPPSNQIQVPEFLTATKETKNSKKKIIEDPEEDGAADPDYVPRTLRSRSRKKKYDHLK